MKKRLIISVLFAVAPLFAQDDFPVRTLLPSGDPAIDGQRLSGTALNINGDNAGNGEITLNPGAVSGNASTILNGGHADDPSAYVRGIASQTANLFQGRFSDNTIVFHIEGENTVGPGDLVTRSIFGRSDQAHSLGGSSNFWNKLWVGEVELKNDDKIFFRDTVGTAINTMHLDSSNFLNIGTVDAITGNGDVIFYRDGVGVAKFIDFSGSTVFVPDVDQTNRIGSENALWLRGHFASADLGRSTVPRVDGSLFIHSLIVGVSSLSLRNRDEDLDSTPELELGTADFIPAVDLTQSIGHSGRRWDGFFDALDVVNFTLVDLTLSGDIIYTTTMDIKDTVETEGIRLTLSGPGELLPLKTGMNLGSASLVFDAWFATADFVGDLTLGLNSQIGINTAVVSANAITSFGGNAQFGQDPNITMVFNIVAGDNVDDDVQLNWLNLAQTNGWRVVWDQSADSLNINDLVNDTARFSADQVQIETIIPMSGADDLGTSGDPWDDIWFNNEIAGGGTVGMDWLPDADSTRNFGNGTTATWATAHVENLQVWTTGEVRRIELNNTIASFTQFRMNNDSGTRRIDIGISATDAAVSLISSVASRNVALNTGSIDTGLIIGVNRVVGPQCSSLPVDATDLATAITLLNAVKDCMNENNHGLAAGT